MLLRSSLSFLLLLAITAPTSAQAKRPLRHTDADDWRTISSPQLSRNGQYVAYAVMPQVGDGEYVVRELKTAKEWRLPTGGTGVYPTAFSSRPAQLRAAPSGGGSRLAFTADSRYLLLTVSPTRKEIDQAKAAKKETPRTALVLLELPGFAVTRIDNVRSWTLPHESGEYVAYSRFALPDPNAPPMVMRPTPAPRPTGSDLVLRNLATKIERTINDVADFSLTKDAKTLVFILAAKKAEESGVYLASPGSGGPPLPLLTGKGRYQQLTWDEKQEQLVFLADQGEPASAASPPRFKVYHWQRGPGAVGFRLPPAQALPGLVTLSTFQAPMVTKAAELLSATTTGMKANWGISERGGLSFSRDGDLLHLATAPVAEPPASPVSADQRIDLDLWHWQDDFIQPMQKVRADQERSRTFRGVYHLKLKKFVQLTDETMQDAALATDGAGALGSDDRPYRRLVGSATFGGFSDVYVLDPIEGKRKLLRKKVEGGLTLSPGGKYALSFDGKHWHSINLVSGQRVNLTEKLNIPFYDEDSDMPGKPRSHGLAGWTAGDGFVVIQDRHDLWRVAPDGSGAKNLTGGAGRRGKLQFRIVSLDPRQRALDLDRPLLLATTNLETLDTGFHRLDPKTGALRCLLMASRSFSMPVKARDADVFLLTAQTFSEQPDLILTDPDFKELKKITDINPQRKELNWGTAELVRFKSADGLPLRAMLVKPENFDPRKKYPMVVYIYERLSSGLHRFVAPRPGTSINPTFFASNGYLVLMPDITYTVGTPGQSALKCVLPAIQAVVDQGVVDEKVIGIQGHSWGGYQISYMVTQTTRFKAAVAGAPVSNMVSAYGGIRWGTGLPRQFQYEQTQSRIGGTLWQYPHRFIENSLIFMADRVSTPLLMLHNDQDDAVPWYQGIEYYLALRRLEKEVYLLNYNGERHGLSKRAHQKDYTVRMQEFFDHHLKGAPKPAWMDRGVSYLERIKKYGPGSPSSLFTPPAPPMSGENEEEEP